MSLDQQNFIYDNVFTDDEIVSIYDIVMSGENVTTQVVPIYCQKVYHFPLPDKVIEKVTNIANQLSNKKLKLTEISFASYSKEYGEMPLLSPHFDNNFEEERFTLDVQLISNISWPIVVRGNSYTLKDNQALTFSGTHQIHWRDFREFKKDDFIDMLFCHFSSAEDTTKITIEEHRQVVSESIYYVNDYYQKIIKEMIKSK